MATQPHIPLLLTIRQVAEAVGVSMMTIQRWVKAGDFPPPLRFGRRVIRWRADALNAWLAEQEQEKAQEQSHEIA